MSNQVAIDTLKMMAEGNLDMARDHLENDDLDLCRHHIKKFGRQLKELEALGCGAEEQPGTETTEGMQTKVIDI
jgi:hypothetical protein